MIKQSNSPSLICNQSQKCVNIRAKLNIALIDTEFLEMFNVISAATEEKLEFTLIHSEGQRDLQTEILC